MTSFTLHGRLALVTGANRGIGQALATALAAAGADVIGASSSMTRSADETRAAVEGSGRRFSAYDVDLGNPEDVQRFVRQLHDDGHRIDTLVNNAGAIHREPALTHSPAQWQRIIDIDLTAQFLLSQALGAGMVERGFGRIISIASLRVWQGGEGVLGYTAAKSGLAGLTRAFANEWTRHGVTVNAVAPGYIATENTRAIQEDPQAYARITDRIPAGRWGTPADLGGAVVFLASTAADYVSGVTLPVDGGWLVR